MWAAGRKTHDLHMCRVALAALGAMGPNARFWAPEVAELLRHRDATVGHKWIGKQQPAKSALSGPNREPTFQNVKLIGCCLFVRLVELLWMWSVVRA